MSWADFELTQEKTQTASSHPSPLASMILQYNRRATNRPGIAIRIHPTANITGPLSWAASSAVIAMIPPESDSAINSEPKFVVEVVY